MFHLLTKRTAWFLPPMTCFSSKAEEIQSAVIAKSTKLLKANKTTSVNPFDRRILDCITELKVPLCMINVFKSLSGNVFQEIEPLEKPAYTVSLFPPWLTGHHQENTLSSHRNFHWNPVRDFRYISSIAGNTRELFKFWWHYFRAFIYILREAFPGQLRWQFFKFWPEILDSVIFINNLLYSWKKEVLFNFWQSLKFISLLEYSLKC